jgi:hypothetical protein
MICCDILALLGRWLQHFKIRVHFSKLSLCQSIVYLFYLSSIFMREKWGYRFPVRVVLRL